MALSTSDVEAVRAQWEEWTVDSGFELSIEVCTEEPSTAVIVEREEIKAAPIFGARITGSLYCQVTVRRGEEVVFSERVPCDAGMLRASVTVLARTIATRWAPSDDRGDA